MSIVLNESLGEEDLLEFRRNAMMENFHRGAELAKFIILFELLLLLTAIAAYFLKIDGRFLFGEYISMYLMMMVFNLLFLLFAGQYKNTGQLTIQQLDRLEDGIMVYAALLMSWGSLLTLMDQKLYGQLVAFMINMIMLSVLFLLDDRRIKVPYGCSVLILAVGLPLFQSSKDILIGHYVNLSIFIFISWLASRIIFKNYYNSFVSRTLLEKSKILLEEEAEEIKAMNIKLDSANRQLQELALVDELTGIPNRRSFRNFVDSIFSRPFAPDSTFTFLMIDIDFFKQYNDHYGHNEADKVLIAVANEIHSIILNPMEFVVRWGGEEFIYCALSEQAVTENALSKLTETIRAKIAALKIPHNVSNHCDFLTVSIGASTICASCSIPVSKGIDLADQALYAAKKDGRNCVKYLIDERAEPIQI